MSLFGKKNSDDLSIDDDGAEVQMNFDGGDAGGSGGGKKNRVVAIAGVLVLVLAGAGAYFMLSGEEEFTPPARPPAAITADNLPSSITDERPLDAPPMPSATGASADAAIGMPPGMDATAPTGVPGAPTAVAADGSAIPADIGAAGTPAVPGALPDATGGVDPLAATTPAGTPAITTGTPAIPGAADPAIAAIDPTKPVVAPIDGSAPVTGAAIAPGVTLDAAKSVTADATGAPVDLTKPATPAVAADTPAVPAITAPAASDIAAIPAVKTANKAGGTTAADIAPIVPAVGDDLPAPALPPSSIKNTLDKHAITADIAAPVVATVDANKTGAVQGTTEKAKTDKKLAVTDKPSKGELAILQNGAVLDQLTASPGADAPVLSDMERAILDANIQDAIVRPVPKKYLVVTKTHNADDVDSRLTAARSALSRGNNTVALQIFNEVYKSYPKDNRVLMGRAVAMQRLGQSDQALAAYEEVLTTNPKNLEALTNMLGLIKQQNPSLAVEKLAALRDAYPENADITAQLGIAYAGAGSYEEASRFLDMAEALSPGSPTVLFNKAVLYDKMGRTREAGELYRQILRMNSDGSLDSQLPIEQIRNRLSTMR